MACTLWMGGRGSKWSDKCGLAGTEGAPNNKILLQLVWVVFAACVDLFPICAYSGLRYMRLKARSGSPQVVAFPDGLDVFVLPDGLGGELLSVGCDDSKLHYFQAALHAARSIAQLIAKNTEKEDGSLGSRAAKFPQQLILAIQGADSGRNVKRHHFDVVTMKSGRWCGIRGVGIVLLMHTCIGHRP